MSPAPLLVAACLAGAALAALPCPSAPPPIRTAGGIPVRGAPGPPTASLAAPVVPVVPVAPVASGASVAHVAAVARAAPAAPVGGRIAVGVRFRWPLSPVPQVLRRFAVGPQPWSPGHRGVDLTAAPGQQVLSARAGTVTFAGMVAGRGVVVVGHPNGIRTTYEPVRAEVHAGEAVAAGAPLGALGTGDHCRACLHWGALRGEVYLDPLTLLRRAAPPVLLPLARAGSGPERAASPP